MKKKILNWGIIGCGSVVEKKSGPAIEKSENSQIIAVMRRDRAKAEDFARRHGIKRFYSNDSDIIKDKEINIVYVATPPDSHSKYCIEAAKAGKDVLVEKPMALNTKECQKMIEACDKAGVNLFVAYYRRFHSHVQKMKEIIQRGEMGEIIQSKIDISMPIPGGLKGKSWREMPEISGGGYFADMGSHRLDAMVYLLGNVRRVLTIKGKHTKTTPVEDTITGILEFESGTQCSVMSDFYSGRIADQFEIYGTNKCLIATPLDEFTLQVKSQEGEKEYTFDKQYPPHYGLIKHIENVINGQAKNESSGQDGIKTTQILDVIYRITID